MPLCERSVQAICDAAERVFRPTPVFLAYAHGSRVSGTPSEESDLDVGYYAGSPGERGPLSIRAEMMLADRLSEALGLEVDLRDLGPAPLELRGRVLENGVRIYSSDEVRRVHLESDLLGRYHDAKEALRRFHEDRLRSIARHGL